MRQRDVCHRRIPSRIPIVLSSTLLAIAGIGSAHADPGDVFALGAPAITDAPPRASDIAAGDTSVATQTGALTYSFAIRVPPGRGSRPMQPTLALTYSSQGSIYGGIATGWSLEGIPIVSVDTTRGRLWSTAFSVPKRNFSSSMAGGRPLVLVTEPATPGSTPYRAQGDDRFVRYEKMRASSSFPWRALSPDGITYVFGASDHVGNCAIVSDEYAPITTTSDEFGNRVDYFYEAGVDGECRIQQIAWGRNDNAKLGHFAVVRFNYAATPPSCADAYVGAKVSYRTGKKIVTGASQLESITAVAFSPLPWSSDVLVQIPSEREHERTIALGYSSATASCSASHAAYRALISIQESAVGIDSPLVALPSIEFAYGNAAVAYPQGNVSGKSWLGTAQESGHNLGWGYRFSGGDPLPTLEAMMLDVDGDGRIDRVTNEPFLDAQGRARFCRARWERNLGGPQRFVDAGYINLPTLKWATPLNAPGGPFVGGAHARANLSTGGKELCALNYQRTGYLNSNDGGVASTCRPGAGVCPVTGFCPNGNDCDPIKYGDAGDTVFAWRWFDINGDARPDLVGSPIKGGLYSYDLQWGPGRPGAIFGAPVEPPIFGAHPLTSKWSCPTISHTAFPADPRQPYTMCGGLFPWFVYLNHGNGSFGKPRRPLPIILGADGEPSHGTWGPLPDQVLYQPIPLETAAGDSSITSIPVGQYQGTFDLDGDGYADGVRALPSNWAVYRNDGTGLLLPSAGTAPYSFGTGLGFSLLRTDVGFEFSQPLSTEGLVDLNGDQLVDHWRACAGCPSADIHFNDGTGFRLGDSFTTSPPGTNGFAYVAPGDRLGSFVLRGRRIDARRILDVDHDGRIDIGRFGTNIPTVQIEFNQGGRFGAAAPGLDLTTYGTGLRREIVASDSIGYPSSYIGSGSPGYTWEIRSDMIDLDGDSIPESVDFGSGFANPYTMIIRRIPTPSQPPRLLVEIKNNRGATTSVTYSSINGPAVEQHPELLRATPYGHWVVQSTTTVDELAGTTSTTSYEYVSPRFHPGDFGRYGFRGFDEVRTTAPSGARIINRYNYVPDWSGRLVTSILEADSSVDRDDTGPRTISDTTWEARRLFGTVETYHPTVIDRWVCKNGQDEAACRANTDTRRRVTSTFTALSSTTDPANQTPLLWRETSMRLMAGENAQDGDRTEVTTYTLASDASTYRLRLIDKRSFVQTAEGSVLYGRVAKSWDPTFRAPLTDEVWFDDVDDNRAIERRVYDMSTGNVTEHWKPNQNAAGTSRSTFEYDDRHLFITRHTNEVGHVREYVYEYGTGVRLATIGPNTAACAQPAPASCPAGTLAREEHRIRIDGWGRTVERFETFSDTGEAYRPRKVEIVSYLDDRPGGTGPTSVTRQVAIDLDATSSIRYTQEKTELDGQSRPIRKIASSFGAAPADHITTYAYRDDGTLREVTLPDPSANDARTVAYLYTFDSIARPTEIIRPDAIDPKDRSRMRIAYDGLSHTITEIVGIAGGQPAAKTIHNDSFGRLVQIDEQLAATPLTWASTTYTYGPDDRVREMVDPEGLTTTLRHDFAGRRTEVTRGGQTWRYGYDRNGNVTFVIAPGSAGPESEAAYSTIITYDDLDRVSSKTIGQRSLSLADQQRFATGTELYSWDGNGGPNEVGVLRSWKTFAPGSSTPVISLDFSSNAQGERTSTTMTLNLDGYPPLARQFSRDYHLTGAPRLTSYHDAVGDMRETTSLVSLDARGMPFSIALSRTGDPDQVIGMTTRNVAGLITTRRTELPGGGMPFIESSWTYDALGRVTHQIVEKAPGPVQVARQDLSYFGNDDPKSLDHWLGTSNHKRFEFSYDHRHQLVGVAETAAGGAFTAAYAYGPAGRLTNVAHAAETLPGGDVTPRNVRYEYASEDPEQVIALVSADNSVFARYEYDKAGNQVTRCLGHLVNQHCAGEALTLVYDGKDQLRRVTQFEDGEIRKSEEYFYDAFGQRVAAIHRQVDGRPAELVWWLGDTEAHYDASGILMNVYSHLTMGTPVARLDRRTGGQAMLELQFQGFSNNMIAAVAEDGLINASFVYAPFGEIIEAFNGGGTTAGLDGHRRRVNDRFVDEISDYVYYGARYHDRTLIKWIQMDPAYSSVPEAGRSNPRRSQLYTVALNNPLRYLDPDGADPVPVVQRVGTPTPAQLAAIGAPPYREAWSAHGWTTNPVIVGQSIVDRVIKTFGFDTDVQVQVVASKEMLTPTGQSAARYYKATDKITIADNYVLNNDPIEIALTLLHEMQHRAGGGEVDARIAEIQGAIKWRGSGTIGSGQYTLLLTGVLSWFVENKPFLVDIVMRAMHMPLAMAWMPEMHQHVFLASEVYRRNSTPYIQGLWGLEVNPDGPAKVISHPQ